MLGDIFAEALFLFGVTVLLLMGAGLFSKFVGFVLSFL